MTHFSHILSNLSGFLLLSSLSLVTKVINLVRMLGFHVITTKKWKKYNMFGFTLYICNICNFDSLMDAIIEKPMIFLCRKLVIRNILNVVYLFRFLLSFLNAANKYREEKFWRSFCTPVLTVEIYLLKQNIKRISFA